MFEIVFLGTSASAPSIHRSLPAAAVIAGPDRFLVDCGEGTQRQILRSGIGFKNLHRILLTHSHLDHILGLGGLISTFTRWEDIEELFIWGSKQTLERVQRLLFDVVLVGQKPPVAIHVNPIDAGLIHTGRRYQVRAFPVVHRGPGCLGYVFEEDTHRPFDVEKAGALGIPAGPERRQLVQGETITLDDGRVIAPDMVLGEEEKGVKVVFTGDIGRLDPIREIVDGADVLVSEATFLEDERDTARRFGHITAKQVAQFARDMGVRHLLLTHVSRRYRESDVYKEVNPIFKGAIVVRDLDHYSIRRGQALEKFDTRNISKQVGAEENE